MDYLTKAIGVWIVLSVCMLHGQTVSSAGAMQGTIVDPSGAAVPAAKVVARNVDSGAARGTQSDGDGHFHFVGLPIGMYTVAVEKAGFSVTQVAPFLVSVGQTAARTITLSLGGVSV
jgi:hypothetical protein